MLCINSRSNRRNVLNRIDQAKFPPNLTLTVEAERFGRRFWRKRVVSKLMELRTEEILRITREKKRTSRVQLAKVTGLSKPTVSSIVNDLVRKGILTETGLGKSKATGGRKPINLSFSPDFKYVLSVDIGGTKAIFALLGEREGRFSFVPGIPAALATAAEIGDFMMLLMEGIKRLDEQKNAKRPAG